MEKNYSKIYREKLFLFVKDTKVNCKKTLYSLVLAKSEELDNELNNEPNNKTKLILFYLLKLSLYFIEENKFITEDYFELNANKIHKAFYELLLNPTESQFENFIISFENLDYGADFIFLICEKLFSNMKFLAIDMYFRIILEKHYDSLKDYFDFPINQNRNDLIKKLSEFSKIKDNKDKISNAELSNLFAEKSEKPAIKKFNDNVLNNEINETIENNYKISKNYKKSKLKLIDKK